MKTAENLTDEEIRELRRSVVLDQSVTPQFACDVATLTSYALDDCGLPPQIASNARARLAAILTTRQAKEQ